MAWRGSLMVLTSAAAVLFFCVEKGDCDFIRYEEELRAALFSNYSVKVRPDYKTFIDVHALIGSLNYLNIAKQSMSINMILNMFWFDGRLVWNETEYGGINNLVTAPEDIWTPPIVIENAVSNVGVVGGKDRDATPARISSDGLVNWFPPLEVTTSCEMTISHYPFDTQSCAITLIGWTYPLSEMNVSAKTVDTTTLFSPNGEFDLMETRIRYIDIRGTDEADTYRKLCLEFTFRRKWEFYGQNLILPIALNSILMNGVFALPVESGEKMGYCLTVLLSYIVFLTWVTENLPPVSTVASILQIYLAVVLCLGCLATLLTTWILHLYHSPPAKPMSRSLRKFASAILVPFMLRTRCVKMTQTDDITHLPNHVIKVAPLQRSLSVRSRKSISDRYLNNGKIVDIDASEETFRSETMEMDTLPICTWQELAILFDNFFLWLFGFVLVAFTTVNMSMLYANY